jgi:ribosomal protein RSM22 (predicted rRNA methylase)
MKENEAKRQNSLLLAIEEELKGADKKGLKEASKELSLRYRNAKKPSSFMTEKEHFQSYLAVRMPATFSAVKEVLNKSLSSLPIYPKSLLDIGAGPGTASFAALDFFTTLQEITLLEKESTLIEIGKRLLKHAGVNSSTWVQGNIDCLPSMTPHDVVIFSYALGEVSQDIETLMRWCWGLTKQVFILVEPGSFLGYQRLMKAREVLLNQGAFLLAPCPHAHKCPLKTGDWCHFTVRLDRSSLHTEIKGASLSYEDEKFSYLVVGREPYPSQDRVIKNPLKRSGHVIFDLCTKEGKQERKTVSKKQGDFYKQMKGVEWGDTI